MVWEDLGNVWDLGYFLISLPLDVNAVLNQERHSQRHPSLLFKEVSWWLAAMCAFFIELRKRLEETHSKNSQCWTESCLPLATIQWKQIGTFAFFLNLSDASCLCTCRAPIHVNEAGQKWPFSELCFYSLALTATFVLTNSIMTSSTALTLFSSFLLGQCLLTQMCILFWEAQ